MIRLLNTGKTTAEAGHAASGAADIAHLADQASSVTQIESAAKGSKQVDQAIGAAKDMREIQNVEQAGSIGKTAEGIKPETLRSTSAVESTVKNGETPVNQLAHASGTEAQVTGRIAEVTETGGKAGEAIGEGGKTIAELADEKNAQQLREAFNGWETMTETSRLEKTEEILKNAELVEHLKAAHPESIERVSEMRKTLVAANELFKTDPTRAAELEVVSMTLLKVIKVQEAKVLVKHWTVFRGLKYLLASPFIAIGMIFRVLEKGFYQFARIPGMRPLGRVIGKIARKSGMNPAAWTEASQPAFVGWDLKNSYGAQAIGRMSAKAQ